MNRAGRQSRSARHRAAPVGRSRSKGRLRNIWWPDNTGHLNNSPAHHNIPLRRPQQPYRQRPHRRRLRRQHHIHTPDAFACVQLPQRWQASPDGQRAPERSRPKVKCPRAPTSQMRNMPSMRMWRLQWQPCLPASWRTPFHDAAPSARACIVQLDSNQAVRPVGKNLANVRATTAREASSARSERAAGSVRVRLCPPNKVRLSNADRTSATGRN